MANVCIERHGPSWRYRFYIAPQDGKRKRVSKSGFRTKMEAIKAGNEAFSQYLNAGQRFTPREISVSDFFDDYMEACSLGWKLNTIRSYKGQIENHIKPKLGQYYLKSLSARSIQDFLNTLFNEGYSRDTVCNMKARLTNALDWAVSMDYIKYNPAKNVKLPSTRAVPRIQPKTKGHIYLSEDIRKKLFEYYPEDHPIHLCFQLGYRAGLRIGEALGLCWEDIDFKNGTLKVCRQLQWNYGQDERKNIYVTAPKYDSFREFKIDKKLLRLLRNRRRFLMQEKAKYGEYWTNYYEDPNGYVVKDSGKPLNLVCAHDNGWLTSFQNVAYFCGKFRKKYNLPTFNFHSLRKTHCTELLANGANPKDVQKRLGHKSIQVTLDIYAEINETMEEKSLEVLEKLS